MGFWGALVVHRGEPLLAELLPDVAEFSDAELCYDGVSGGWQVTRVFTGSARLPVDVLTRLRATTGAPVLAAEIIDSDAAFVSALGSRTPGWRAWLQVDRAIGFLLPPPAPFAEDGTFLGDDWRDPEYERRADDLRAQILADVPGGSLAATAAVAWAGEAGLEPESVDVIAATLDGDAGLVEDRFFALLGQLGIATDIAHAPAPLPAIVDVLRSLFGQRLDALAFAPHGALRGEQLPWPGRPDLRLRFDDGQAVRACACAGDFALWPTSTDPATIAAETVPVDVAGRRLTGAATIRRGYLPHLRGVVLRFEELHDLFIAAIDGDWTVANGSTPPQHLIDRLGPRWREEIHVNPWIAANG
jgi:hypothetical protein